MTKINLDPAMFPILRSAVRAQWAALLFEPIAGSYERFVIGVVAFTENRAHTEWANQLDRLKCFYGNDAEGAISAIKIASEYFDYDLSKRGKACIFDPNPAISAFKISTVRDAEGLDLESIAREWMAGLSSLYSKPDIENEVIVLESLIDSSRQERAADRLPFLVYDYITNQRDTFKGFFSIDLQSKSFRRSKGSSHKVIIDFSGSKIVANFGTLKSGSLTSSVNLIKRRLWDLKVSRDRIGHSEFYRIHEMIVHKPSASDPQITERQHANMQEALDSLVEQADQEELRLRPMSSVEEIGNHILSIEAA